MTTLYLVRKWFLKSVKQYSKWECGLSSSPTSPCHAGIQGENNFNSNMSYRAWLCVKILRSYAGFQVTLVYELTSSMMFAKSFNSFIRQIFDLCVMMILFVLKQFLNLFKISDFMSCLNTGISIQVIFTKFYVKYYLLVLHTSICVITNSLFNT